MAETIDPILHASEPDPTVCPTCLSGTPPPDEEFEQTIWTE